ncbi:hypothetical protein LB505_010409 [Fusarium chuoi]|nr:hypothetical protein LB505_010409 [Fusarium chuoi]
MTIRSEFYIIPHSQPQAKTRNLKPARAPTCTNNFPPNIRVFPPSLTSRTSGFRTHASRKKTFHRSTEHATLRTRALHPQPHRQRLRRVQVPQGQVRRQIAMQLLHASPEAPRLPLFSPATAQGSFCAITADFGAGAVDETYYAFYACC